MDQKQYEALRESEFAIYDEEVGKANDPIMSVLLSHLFIEHLIERYLAVKLKATKGLLGKNGLTFEKKVCLMEAFGEIDNQLIVGVRKLNELRNDCVHRFKHQPTQKQVEDLGRTFGKAFKEIKAKYPDDKHYCLGAFIARLCGEVHGVVLSVECHRA